MSDALPSADVPVLIAGGGPIGLALAADLGRRGIRTLLIERRPDKLAPAKMLEVGVRTMEFCRQLGIADQVRTWGFPLDATLDSVFVTSLRGHELGRVRMQPLGVDASSAYSPERMRPCPQTWFDPILQKYARSFETNELRYEVELEDFVQSPTGVTSTVLDRKSGRRETIRSQYLVGCDGWESTVRQQLGIDIRGRKHIDWSMNQYLRIPGFLSQHRTSQAFRYVFVGPEGSWSFLTMVDGKDLFRLQLYGLDREKLEAVDIDAAIERCFGGKARYTLEDKVFWVRKMTIADRFMDGRVFIAGDAAHAHPPNGGLGMNTGIQDAFDLGWKLAAVLKGWGGPVLLDSYEYERRPASSRAAEVSLMNYGRLNEGSRNAEIEAPGAAGDAARRRVGETLVKENEKAWHPPGVHIGHIYFPSPIVVPDGTARPEDDTVSYTPTTFPGARAPHAWLAPGTSTLDLFGGGFVLMDFGAASTAGVARAAKAKAVPLEVRRIDNREAAQLYEKKLVLVRPDGHVAWRGDSEPRDCDALIDVVRGAGPRVAARRAGEPC